ncbi:hypothetical protein [Azospirillum sp.]|uniref:hypothetical protein n=1 Tax=Azospirillum sp. TaxID=34012 RepID=UPI003D70CB12
MLPARIKPLPQFPNLRRFIADETVRPCVEPLEVLKELEEEALEQLMDMQARQLRPIEVLFALGHRRINEEPTWAAVHVALVAAARKMRRARS